MLLLGAWIRCFTTGAFPFKAQREGQLLNQRQAAPSLLGKSGYTHLKAQPSCPCESSYLWPGHPQLLHLHPQHLYFTAHDHIPAEDQSCSSLGLTAALSLSLWGAKGPAEPPGCISAASGKKLRTPSCLQPCCWLPQGVCTSIPHTGCVLALNPVVCH